MKLIGENSLSTVINKLLIIGFAVQVMYLGYLIFGFIISYINRNTASSYFAETFKIGNFEDEVKKVNSESLDFQFKMPFSDSVTTGDYSLFALTSIIFFLGFYCLFTLYLFKIFKGMSTDIIFNKKVIVDLKRFGLLNLLFIPFYCILLFFIDKSLFHIDPIFILLHFSIGVVILFIIEFFKKGFELQTQNDLTI
ncbi:DUF2975 domain-containing protein [Chryseobacterium shigense]|uniref:Uncharacterized membrane protein YciS (DUF1049 family) n=1 Tax=Chryseobacterium shigense TaxID=297244 RepID=A0A841NFI2_9FLAO|nr:DUF2975 domain-containing protein [Chryseobacterium shigense]MBB6372598.1 uncharacterized membrane protein YciS (DUF1049 family) [Chryseobacterium shigense]